MDRIVRSANAGLVSLIVESFCIPSALESFLKTPANSVPFWTQNFLVGFCFVIVVKKAQAVFLESFGCLLLHLLFYQTPLDEIVETLHHSYPWLVFQHMIDPYSKFAF